MPTISTRAQGKRFDYRWPRSSGRMHPRLKTCIGGVDAMHEAHRAPRPIKPVILSGREESRFGHHLLDPGSVDERRDFSRTQGYSPGAPVPSPESLVE